ncbi:hypothetical protein CRYUN_Cryun29cG0061000 [Craigia yunnanensis]
MTLYTIPIWFAIFLFLLPLLLLLKKDKKLHPPSPPKLPILGNLHQLGTLPHASLRNLSNKYDPVMLLRLGRLSTVVISSAEAARMVLKNHDLDCCSRPSLVGIGRLSYNCLDISFSPYGDYWRQLRKVCVVELFNSNRVQSYRFIREEEVASLINSISQSYSILSPFGNNPVDLTEKLFCFAASIICRMAFGKLSFQESGFNNSNDRIEEMVREAMIVFGSFSASEYFPYVGWIIDRLTGLHGRIERIFHKLDGFFEQVIDEHLNPEPIRNGDHEDIVDVLLRIQSDGVKFGEALLTKDSIKAVIMDLFLAGVETNAATVNWAMAELARNPRVMRKAQDEVRTFSGNKNGIVTEDDIDQLQYLKMVVKETLRLHPPLALLLPRETMSHFRINGYDIQPKTLIQVNVWAIGRDPRYWRNPEDFFPGFSDSSIDFRGQHFEFLPFGGGRRSCPGMNLATRIMELALANLLHCFDWKIPFGMKGMLVIDMEEAAGPSLTIAKKTALHLVPVDRVQC